MPRGRPIGGNATIKDMLKRPPPSSQQLTSNSEDEDLRIALQLSKQEHVNEQKRIFEQLARLSRHSSQTEDKSGFRLKKRRIIQRDSDEDEDEDNDIMVKTVKDTEDEDQWFQTVSSRPQPRRRISLSKNKSKERTKKIVEKKPIKKEPEKNQVLLDIDDVSELITKEEEEESYDLTSLLMDESDTNITEDRNDAEAPKDEQSDSDCSVIDLVETPWTEDIPQAEEEKEDDDGYLSPLEGFTSLKDVGDDASYNNYYNQFRSSAASTPSATRPKTTRRKKTTSTSTPKKKKFYRKFWAKKRKQ